MQASDRVTLQGKPCDRLTYERHRSLCMLVRSREFGGERGDITVIQAIGGAAASAGTHVAPGGSLDMTYHNVANRCLGDRMLGGAGWPRPTLPGVWVEHYHTVTAGAGYAPATARRQVTSLYAGRNGLANDGRDTGPRLKVWPLFVAPWTEKGRRGTYYAKKGVYGTRTARDGSESKVKIPKGAKVTVIAVVNRGGTLCAINSTGLRVTKANLSISKPSAGATPLPTQKKATTRVGTFNLPAPGVGIGKNLGNDARRIDRAASQILARSLSVVAIQEGGARARAETGSDFMEGLADSLGGGWDLLVPTTAANENYLLRRKADVDLVERFEDAVIRGTYRGKTLPGKHVTRGRFATEAGNLFMGSTHLLPNDPGAADVQAGLAADAMLDVGKSGHARVLLGDLNMHGTPPAVKARGFRGARTEAPSEVRDMDTFVTYRANRPTRGKGRAYDQVLIDGHLRAVEYGVVAGTNGGVFEDPRASDHLLTWAGLQKA